MSNTIPLSTAPKRTCRAYWTKLFIGIVLATVAGLSFVGYRGYRWLYPYGRSHSCDKQLILALENYAVANGGAFPAGEPTPEASLSLLYPTYANEYILQGRTVPLDLVSKTLAAKGRLGPTRCGWHYVEGLQNTDDPGLAIFWDKVGLGHNGERRDIAGHTVFFLDGHHDFIEESKWPDFLRDQARLLNEKEDSK